jgi:hypothetical protein
MISKLIATVLAAGIGVGIAATPASAQGDWRHERACDAFGFNCATDKYYYYYGRDRDRDWYRYRGRNYDRRDYYRGAPTTYQPAGACTFYSRRGPRPGYRPVGKDRCCIETSRGPSCQ